MACLAALTISAPVPEADPDAFLNLGAVAVPAITGSALIDGLLLGKVAFLKGKWGWSVIVECQWQCLHHLNTADLRSVSVSVELADPGLQHTRPDTNLRYQYHHHFSCHPRQPSPRIRVC